MMGLLHIPGNENAVNCERNCHIVTSDQSMKINLTTIPEAHNIIDHKINEV